MSMKHEMHLSKNSSDIRDLLIFKEVRPWHEDKHRKNIVDFEADLNTLKGLVNRSFLERDEEADVGAPSAGAIMDFLEEHEEFTALCYVVTPYRRDTRVTVKGLRAKSDFQDVIEDFVYFARFATEFTVSLKTGECYAEWD